MSVAEFHLFFFPSPPSLPLDGPSARCGSREMARENTVVKVRSVTQTAASAPDPVPE